MEGFFKQLEDDFRYWGKILNINDFKSEVKNFLSEKGFRKENSRLIFSVCPDDINRLFERETIENTLKKEYNGEFNLGSLAAFPIGGVSGITAASHHPPDNIMEGGRKQGNLIFYLSPHLGLIKKDDFLYGKIIRPGQEKVTSSCGAIMGFIDQLKKFGDPGLFSITDDKKNIDPVRVVLYDEFLDNYSKELKDILSLENEKQQVIDIFKLNYEVVINKGNQMINEFLVNEKNHFKGKIAIIGGLTVNTIKEDIFILKELSLK